MVSYSREGSACATHGASGSHWQRRSLERGGWNVAMVLSSNWQEGMRGKVPAGGEWSPSCPGHSLWKALCRVRTFTCLLVGAWAKGSMPLSCTRWDKAWRERSGEWQRDALWRSCQEGFSAPAPHQCLPASEMHKEQAQDDLMPSKPASA